MGKTARDGEGEKGVSGVKDKGEREREREGRGEKEGRRVREREVEGERTMNDFNEAPKWQMLKKAPVCF